MLLHRQSARRVWVEFEVSRADPAANHAKFGTARFLEGQGGEGDAFVSMASRHIVPGRLALAAGAAMLLRGFGIPAFQVDLLPGMDCATIQRLNSRPIAGPLELDARTEIERVLQVSDAALVQGGHRIHKADNPFAVGINVRQWNDEMLQPALAQLWGRRRFSYFFFDPAIGLFAPSKFCAFVPQVRTAAAAQLPEMFKGRPAGMTMPVYAALGENDPRFDGGIAWKHLHFGLGYERMELSSAGTALRSAFERWLERVEIRIQVRAPVYLMMPAARSRWSSYRRSAAAAA